MEIKEYTQLHLAGQATFQLPAGAFETGYALQAEGTKETHQDDYAVEKIELRLQIAPAQLPLLQQWQPDIPADCRVLVLLGTPALRERLLLTEETTLESWTQTHAHLLYDLEQYVWSQAQGADETLK